MEQLSLCIAVIVIFSLLLLSRCKTKEGFSKPPFIDCMETCLERSTPSINMVAEGCVRKYPFDQDGFSKCVTESGSWINYVGCTSFCPRLAK